MLVWLQPRLANLWGRLHGFDDVAGYRTAVSALGGRRQGRARRARFISASRGAARALLRTQLVYQTGLGVVELPRLTPIVSKPTAQGGRYGTGAYSAWNMVERSAHVSSMTTSCRLPFSSR